MKHPVKFSFEGPAYIVALVIVALLIVGGFSIDPLLTFFAARAG